VSGLLAGSAASLIDAVQLASSGGARLMLLGGVPLREPAGKMGEIRREPAHRTARAHTPVQRRAPSFGLG